MKGYLSSPLTYSLRKASISLLSVQVFLISDPDTSRVISVSEIGSRKHTVTALDMCFLADFLLHNAVAEHQ